MSNFYRGKDRRRKKDLWVQSIHIINFLVWALLIWVVGIIGFAKPQEQSFLDRFFHVDRYNSWDLEMMKLAFYLMIFSFLFSIFGMYINYKRSRRRSDSFSYGLIFSLTFSFLGIVYYILRF